MSVPSLLPVRCLRALSIIFLLSLSALTSHSQQVSLLPDIINEQNLITLKGNVPVGARVQNDQGQVAGNLPMDRMILVLKRSDAKERALQAALQAMHDPKSAQFHHWLTPGQFGALYGPSDADLARLTAWLKNHGFQVNQISAGRGTIEFSGSADAVTGAFHTQIHTYVVNGEKHYANATDPKIPAALTPVVAGVLSLHNFAKQAHARMLGKAQTDPAKAAAKTKASLTYQPLGAGPAFTTGGSNYVGPGDLWTIYNTTPLITASSGKIDGTGQTVAIVGRSDINSNDLVGFRANLLPAPYSTAFPFTQINNGPDPGIVSGDDLEQTLDVEYSSALAPAAQIDLVVSGSTNSTDGVDLSALYIVDNNLAPVMSTSYGACEAIMGTAENAFYNSVWEQAAAQGITAMVSSGDNGSAGCDQVGPSGSDSIGYVADEGLQVSGLASTPYNVAVGGNEFTDDTSTYWNPNNSSSPAPYTSALSYVPETVWNESCSPLVCGNAGADIAAGSGGASGCFNPTLDSNNNIISCSGGYPAPDWQAGVFGLSNDNKRHLPDISLNAAGHDGYMICYENSCDAGSFYVVGGTSASSPAFAGMMSLVNQSTGSRQGQANYTLYRLAGSQYGTPDAPNEGNLSSCNASNGNTVGSSCIFHDVTTGSNAVPCDGGTLNCSSTTAGAYGVLTDYSALPGYDSATGLGSVNVANLVQHWNDSTLAATKTTLSLGATTSTFGSPVAIVVSVAPTSGSGTPTGNVALITDSTIASAIGAGTVTLSNGGFSGNISSLPGGSYHVSARYAGDDAFAASASASSAITVAPAASNANLTVAGYDPITKTAVSGTALPYGSVVVGSVALTGVSGQMAPSGTVSFFSGNAKLTDTTTAADGTTNYTSTGNGIGSYSWTANYAGNNNYKGSSSSAVAFTIVKAPTVTKLLTNTSYVVGSGSATLTAIVHTDSLLLNPTGTVAFSVNGKPAGTATVAAYTDPGTGASGASASTQVDASLFTSGSNTLSASYAGDSDYSGSSSTSTSIGYSPTTPVNTIAFSAAPTSVTSRQPVALTATVTTGGTAATAGTVEFFDGSILLGAAQVAGNNPAKGFTTGNAVLTTILGPGNHSLEAIYEGIAASPVAVTSTATNVTVSGVLPSSTALAAATSSANAANYDLTATVSGYGFASPSSSVDFTETSVIDDLGTASVDSAHPAHTFQTPMVFSSGDPSGATPSLTVTADFNGDGIPDIATANASFTSGTMSVLIGNGDGTFKAPQLYPSGIFASAIAVGDFNNDGALDLVVTSQGSPTSPNNGIISIYLGNGDGTFQQQLVLNEPGYPVSSVVGDFNHDGILDVATLLYYPGEFTVAFGNGDGTFQTPVEYPVRSQLFDQWTIVAGDFNGDGSLDLAEANSYDNSVGIFLNNGNGTFALKNYLAVTNPQWLTVSDLNGDGKQDLLAIDYGDETVDMFMGKGDGTFEDPTPYVLSGFPDTLALSDLDGDGKLDLAAGIFYPSAYVAVLKGNGDGTFGAETDYPTNQGHGYGVTLSDLNGDGTPDIISSDIDTQDGNSHGIAVLLNVTQAKAQLANVAIAGPLGVQQQLQAVSSGDGNYDASSSAGIYVKGSGAKSTPVILWTPASPWGAGIALGNSALNAVIDGNIAGSFTYTAQPSSGPAFTVTTATTLAAGTYTLTATFTPVDSASYATATATRTVVIQSADFALETATSSLTIAAGSSGTVTVSVPALYGFSGTIALSGGSLPGGFTVSASPASITAGGSSTVTIQTAGLSTTAAMHPSKAQTEVLVAGGAGLACLLLIPIAKRRRYPTWLVLVSVASTLIGLNGCGGIGFSTSTVSLTSSASKSASGSSLTLTAKVASRHSNPSGTVTFYNGFTILGPPVAVSAGSASLSISSLPVGLDSLTAVYSGDSHNSGATSSVVPQLITGQTSVQIVGTSGSISHATDLQVTLQ